MKRLLLLLSVITLLSCSNEECEEERQKRIETLLNSLELTDDDRKKDSIRDSILEEQNKDCN